MYHQVRLYWLRSLMRHLQRFSRSNHLRSKLDWFLLLLMASWDKILLRSWRDTKLAVSIPSMAFRLLTSRKTRLKPSWTSPVSFQELKINSKKSEELLIYSIKQKPSNVLLQMPKLDHLWQTAPTSWAKSTLRTNWPSNSSTYCSNCRVRWTTPPRVFISNSE